LIDDIIELARDAEVSDELKRQAYGMDDLGLDPFSDDGRAYVNDPNPKVETLETFLQALMYSGRDRDSAAALKKYFRDRNEDKDEIVRTICEKRMNLGVYFRDGLQLAKDRKLDIDKF
jgi:hypothetical protein